MAINTVLPQMDNIEIMFTKDNSVYSLIPMSDLDTNISVVIEREASEFEASYVTFKLTCANFKIKQLYSLSTV